MKRESKQSEEQTVVLLDESLRATDGFTQIPNSVLRHPTLTMGAKGVYSVLLSYAWQENFCHPAQESLARDCGIGIRQVQRLLKELKVVGAITWKQLGLNRPNRYYIHSITDWIKPQPVSNPLKEKDTTNMSRPETTYTSGQDTTNMSGQEATLVSHYKDSKKNTQLHTHKRGSVCSPLEKEKAEALIARFHAEHGRAAKGRRTSKKELDFALTLISELGFERADHVITYGLKSAERTNYEARHFQGFEQYVAEAVQDFESHQKRQEQLKRAEERERAEELERIEHDKEYYAQPLEERVELQVEVFRKRTELLKHRTPTQEEEAAHREKWSEIERRNATEFFQRLKIQKTA